LGYHQQDASCTQQADCEPVEENDPGQGVPAMAAADKATYRLEQVGKGTEGSIRDRQETGDA
jgi:hypothetical protein